MLGPRLLLLAGLAACAIALLTGGLAAPARVLLSLGAARPAAQFLTDPAWRGVALYHGGAWEAAETEFTTARQFRNQGNAALQARNYAAALEAYDLARLSGDPLADQSFERVAAFYAALLIDAGALVSWKSREDGAQQQAETGQGEARAAGTGDTATNTGATPGLPELGSHGPVSPRKTFDKTHVAANDRWIATLPDAPGRYLKQRIRHEYKRRKKRRAEQAGKDGS